MFTRTLINVVTGNSVHHLSRVRINFSEMELLKEIEDKSSDFLPEDIDALLLACVYLRQVVCVPVLLSLGANTDNETMLHICNEPEVMHLLISYGAKIAYSPDEDGWYPYKYGQVNVTMHEYWQSIGVVQDRECLMTTDW